MHPCPAAVQGTWEGGLRGWVDPCLQGSAAYLPQPNVVGRGVAGVTEELRLGSGGGRGVHAQRTAGDVQRRELNGDVTGPHRQGRVEECKSIALGRSGSGCRGLGGGGGGLMKAS